MALTRKLLKGMGLTEEQIDSVIDAHTETVDGLKTQIEGLKADAEKSKDLQKELEELRNGKDWKAEHDKLKKEFDSFKSSTEAKEAESAKREALRKVAKEAGLSEAGINKVVKYTDLAKIELDKDGGIKDADKLTADLKNEWGEYVATTQTRGANVATPPTTGKATRSKDEIMAIKDTAERQKAIAENHELFGF